MQLLPQKQARATTAMQHTEAARRMAPAGGKTGPLICGVPLSILRRRRRVFILQVQDKHLFTKGEELAGGYHTAVPARPL